MSTGALAVVKPDARQSGRLDQPRADRIAGGRRCADRRLRGLGAACPRADAADRVLLLTRVLAGNAAIFLTFASLFGAVFFFAQLLQFGLGFGPLETGLKLLPWTATFATVAPLAGALADKIGERPLMVTGLTLQAVGLG